MSTSKLVRLEMEGRSVMAAIRKRHRDGTVTVEPCSGEWMGRKMRVTAAVIYEAGCPAVDRAMRMDAERRMQKP
jgi:hypothetical protein